MAGEALHDSDTVDARDRQEKPKPASAKTIGGVAATTSIRRPSWICRKCSVRPACQLTRRNTYSQPGRGDSNPDSPECQALQLSFGSKHTGIAQMVFCDGHVEAVREDIDKQVWSDYGTRSGQILATGGGAVD